MVQVVQVMCVCVCVVFVGRRPSLGAVDTPASSRPAARLARPGAGASPLHVRRRDQFCANFVALKLNLSKVGRRRARWTHETQGQLSMETGDSCSSGPANVFVQLFFIPAAGQLESMKLAGRQLIRRRHWMRSAAGCRRQSRTHRPLATGHCGPVGSLDLSALCVRTSRRVVCSSLFNSLMRNLDGRKSGRRPNCGPVSRCPFGAREQQFWPPKEQPWIHTHTHTHQD